MYLRGIKLLKESSMTHLTITPVGGLGETGALNCMLYETETAAVVVDCGIGFVDDRFPGVQYRIPSFEMLKTKREKLKALILTHGHEDHLGAAPFFLKEFSIPVYATDFTRGILQHKISEFAVPNVEIHQMQAGDILEFDDLKIRPQAVDHSILDVVALCVEGGGKKALHITDFKIDQNPNFAATFSEDVFRDLGKEGIDLLMMDSTNCLHDGWTQSEATVRENLLSLFQGTKKRIIACLFASNMHRVQSLIDCARETGRKVAITGRSAKQYVALAASTDRLNLDGIEFHDVEEMNHFKDHEVLVLCTGSQAEPRSVLSRMSRDEFKPFRLREGDLVVMSSKMIPGNEGRIMEMMNAVAKLGAEIVSEEDDLLIHASGHALQGELKMIYDLIQPKYFMPIHGEYRYLQRHQRLACEWGMAKENSILVVDGESIRLHEDGIERIAFDVFPGVFISDNLKNSISKEAVKRRRKMAWNGLVVVSVLYNHASDEIMFPVLLETEGLFGGDTEEELRTELMEVLHKEIKSHSQLDFEIIQKFIKVEVRHFCKVRYQLKPEVVVLIHEI